MVLRYGGSPPANLQASTHPSLHLFFPGAADFEVVDAADAEAEAIEDSSSEDDVVLGNRRRAPALAPRRAGNAASAAAAAAAGAGGSVTIGKFFEKLPRGVPSNAALAAMGLGSASSQAMRPASSEEQQLDDLDYANRLVGGVQLATRQDDILYAFYFCCWPLFKCCCCRCPRCCCLSAGVWQPRLPQPAAANHRGGTAGAALLCALAHWR